jgi:hypothetical protein
MIGFTIDTLFYAQITSYTRPCQNLWKRLLKNIMSVDILKLLGIELKCFYTLTFQMYLHSAILDQNLCSIATRGVSMDLQWS